MSEIEAVKPDKKSSYLQIIFLIVLIAAICALVFSTITILKNKEMLANPLGYNMYKFGISSCSCLNEDGRLVLLRSINSSLNTSVELYRIENDPHLLNTYNTIVLLNSTNNT